MDSTSFVRIYQNFLSLSMLDSADSSLHEARATCPSWEAFTVTG
jgi:hypothetical protein